MDAATILNSAFSMVAFVMLVCMLASVFKDSGRLFRWSVKGLAVGLLVSCFAPVLFWEQQVSARELIVNVCLAIVLFLMRLRQAEPAWYARLDAAACRFAERLRGLVGRRGSDDVGKACAILMGIVFALAMWFTMPRATAMTGGGWTGFNIAIDRQANTVTMDLGDFSQLVSLHNRVIRDRDAIKLERDALKRGAGCT